MSTGPERPADGRDLRLVLEGLGVSVVGVAAAWGAGLVAGGATAETVLYVLAPAYLLLLVLSVVGVLHVSGKAGSRARIAALGPRPGWVGLRQGLLVGVVGLVLLGLLEGSLRVPVGASAEAVGSAVGLVRAHPWASVAGVAVAGAAEEVVYRGWGLLLIRRARPSLTIPALVVSSLLFGVAHVLAPALGFVHYALVGLVFGSVALTAGSVLPGAVLHAGMNAAVMAAVAFGG